MTNRCFDFVAFINSVTDAYDDDSSGAPISRYYTKCDLHRLLGKFAAMDVIVTGNWTGWDDLPASFLLFADWLLSKSAANWPVVLEK